MRNKFSNISQAPTVCVPLIVLHVSYNLQQQTSVYSQKNTCILHLSLKIHFQINKCPETPAISCGRSCCNYNCSMCKTTFGFAVLCFHEWYFFPSAMVWGWPQQYIYTVSPKDSFTPLVFVFKSCLSHPKLFKLLEHRLTTFRNPAPFILQYATAANLLPPFRPSCPFTQFLVQAVCFSLLPQLERKRTQHLLTILC